MFLAASTTFAGVSGRSVNDEPSALLTAFTIAADTNCGNFAYALRPKGPPGSLFQ